MNIHEFDLAIIGGPTLAEIASSFIKIKTAAKQVDPPDETGALEGKFSAPVEQVLALMGEIVKDEFETIYAYHVYANSLRDLAHSAIADHFDTHADDELGHADFLLQRMAVLGGPVNVPDVQAPPPATDPVEIVKIMIRYEQEAIAKWRALIMMMGDSPMKITVEDYAAKELEHLDDLWQLLPHEVNRPILQQKIASDLFPEGGQLPAQKATAGDVAWGAVPGAAIAGGVRAVDSLVQKPMAGAAASLYGHLADDPMFASDTAAKELFKKIQMDFEGLRAKIPSFNARSVAGSAIGGALAGGLSRVGLTSDTENPGWRGAGIGALGGALGGGIAGGVGGAVGGGLLGAAHGAISARQLHGNLKRRAEKEYQKSKTAETLGMDDPGMPPENFDQFQQQAVGHQLLGRRNLGGMGALAGAIPGGIGGAIAASRYGKAGPLGMALGGVGGAIVGAAPGAMYALGKQRDYENMYNPELKMAAAPTTAHEDREAARRAASKAVAWRHEQRKYTKGERYGDIVGRLVGAGVGAGSSRAATKNPLASIAGVAVGQHLGGHVGRYLGKDKDEADYQKSRDKEKEASVRFATKLAEMQGVPGKIAFMRKHAFDGDVSQWLAQEQMMGQVQEQAEADYFKQQAQQAKTLSQQKDQEAQGLQQQLQQLQQQQQQMQQALDQSGQVQRQVLDQARQVEQAATQSAASAHQTATASMLQTMQSQQEIMRHKGMTSNMQQAVQEWKDQLMQIAQADPTQGAGQQVGMPLSGPAPQPPAGQEGMNAAPPPGKGEAPTQGGEADNGPATTAPGAEGNPSAPTPTGAGAQGPVPTEQQVPEQGLQPNAAVKQGSVNWNYFQKLSQRGGAVKEAAFPFPHRARK